MKNKVSQFFKNTIGHFDVFDFIGLIGLIVLGVGLWEYDYRLSLITCGAIVCLVSVMGARRSGPIK